MSSIVIVISFSLLIVVSFCGNTLVCRTLFRQRRFCANSTNVLIGMLAISDLMMTIFNIPFTVADIILNDWIFGDFVCILVSFVQANSVYVSSFTMAVIAIDRCKAIYKFRPQQSSNDSTNNNHIANNGRNINENTGTCNDNRETSNNRPNGGGNGCCCLMDCFIFNISCPLIKSNNKSVHLSSSSQQPQSETSKTRTTRFKLELRTKMILIISAIWIMAALHSLPHTIFNRVTVIEMNNIVVESGLTNTNNNRASLHENNRKNDFEQGIGTTEIATIEAFDDSISTDSDKNSNHKYPKSSSSTTAMIMETNQTRTIRRCIPVTPTWFGAKFSLWLTLYTTATQYIIPLSCAAIIYTRIAFTINSQGKVGQMTESRAEKINKHKRRRLLMLALIVAIFAICWLPFNVYYLLLDFGITKSYNHTAFLFCLWLATSSVCYNPFVYCWLNKSFRQEAKNVWNCLSQLFSCFCCKGGQQQQQQSDQQLQNNQIQFQRQSQNDHIKRKPQSLNLNENQCQHQTSSS